MGKIHNAFDIVVLNVNVAYSNVSYYPLPKPLTEKIYNYFPVKPIQTTYDSDSLNVMFAR